jgi:hypothetical protein
MADHTQASTWLRQGAALAPVLAMKGIVDAVQEFEQEITDLEVWHDLGPHMSCWEATGLSNLFTALGLRDHARALMQGHAAKDEEGDAHYQEPEEASSGE